MNLNDEDMPTPGLEEAFRIVLTFAPKLEIGRLPTGGRRTIRPVESGSVHGPRLQGVVVLGSETCLTRMDGVTTAEISYVVRTEDGAGIRLYGTGCQSAQSDFDGYRFTVACEVDESSEHAWLATRAFIAERASGSEQTLVMQIV